MTEIALYSRQAADGTWRNRVVRVLSRHQNPSRAAVETVREGARRYDTLERAQASARLALDALRHAHATDRQVPAEPPAP